MTVAADALLPGNPASIPRLVVPLTRKQRVYSYELSLTDETEARRALDRPPLRVGFAGEALLVHDRLARVAQRLDGGGVPAAVREAGAAATERVRAAREAWIDERLLDALVASR